MSDTQKLFDRAHQEGIGRPDYFIRLELDLTTIRVIAAQLSRAMKDQMPGHATRTTHDVMTRLRNTLENDGLPRNAELVEALDNCPVKHQ